jgi:proliferating cell nuclear antigen
MSNQNEEEEDYILKVQTVQSHVIKILCDVLKETLNDVNFLFDETGMRVMAMDGSHVALVRLRLNAPNFESYLCKEKLQVGLNMNNLFKLIKTVTNIDIITFFITNDNRHEFGVRIENADKNTQTTFRLKMLDIDEVEIRIPDIQLDSVITMPSNDFQRLCRDMLNIDETIIMTSSNNSLRLACNGDFASQETIIGEANHGLTFTKCDDDVVGKFSLKYINLFTKSTNLSNTLEIYLKPNFPLMLRYNVANLGDVMFCLAPTLD